MARYHEKTIGVNELKRAVFEQNHYTRQTVTEISESLFAEIAKQLLAGNNVMLKGVGTIGLTTDGKTYEPEYRPSNKLESNFKAARKAQK